MRDRKDINLDIRNQESQAAHRRQVLWQITVPFILCFIAFLVFAVGANLGTNGQVRLWADVALIFLLLPPIALFLLFIALVGSLLYAIIWLIGKLPTYTFRAQEIVFKIETKVRVGADKAVEPILKYEGFRAGLRALRRR